MSELGLFYLDPKGLPVLQFSLPLPPPDNLCHANGSGGRFATSAYKAWLREAAPQLREALGDWTPDTEHWWRVNVDLWLGSRGDGPNYLKPLLDLLSGSYVDEAGQPDPLDPSRRVGKGKIRKPGALWDDDRRVFEVQLTVNRVRYPEPTAFLTVSALSERPLDWKEHQAEQARTERELARCAARAARERVKAEGKARQAAEREQAKAARLAAKGGR